MGLPLVTLTPVAEVATTVANEAFTASLNSRTTSLGAVVRRASTPGVILTSSAWAEADVAVTTEVTMAKPKADDATTATVTADRRRRDVERGRYHDERVDMGLVDIGLIVALARGPEPSEEAGDPGDPEESPQSRDGFVLRSAEIWPSRCANRFPGLASRR